VFRLGTMTRMVVVLTLTAALGVSGFLAAGSIARGASGTNATVSLRKTKLGLILVNSRGHTLYLFAKDRNGKSACSNGSLQVTYNKHPLYAYTLDKQAGQTKGEGSLRFGAKWYAVSARGTAVVKPSTTTTTTTTTTTCAYPPCP
jgi:predicted lipoprotein with Yx(FWY)xxD motif